MVPLLLLALAVLNFLDYGISEYVFTHITSYGDEANPIDAKLIELGIFDEAKILVSICLILLAVYLWRRGMPESRAAKAAVAFATAFYAGLVSLYVYVLFFRIH